MLRRMFIEETVTYLEMTSPDQLVPGRPAPTPVEMERVGRTSLRLVRSTYERIAAPHNWIGRSAWSDEQWGERLSRAAVQAWIAWVEKQVAGLVELEVQSGGDVEIVVFGLVPEFVGKGFGGHILALGTRLAWKATSADGGPTKRVWLHTSSRDHPHARPNYERRGFRAYRTEQRRREITG
jgi:GNAT superfamily N-acetyltransferase